MNDLRGFVERLSREGLLHEVDHPVAADLGLARAMLGRSGQAVRFSKVTGFGGTVVGSVLSSRRNAALACGVDPRDLIAFLGRADAARGSVTEVSEGPFQRTRYDRPDLAEILPLGRFFDRDGGPYTTASIVAARSQRSGMNLSFHRMMHLGLNRFSVRVVRRHLHQILEEGQGRGRAAVCIGVHPAVCLAAATSGPPELDELELASALLGGELECVDLGEGIRVPAHTEVVMLGRFTGEQAEEGPFVDLTGTYDVVRTQPVFEVDVLFHRPDPVYHVILPGGMEHKLLMGLPREPSILRAARAAAPSVVDAVLTPGGGAWLHAVVQMKNPAAGQPVNGGAAALAAHPSLKRVTLVDDDIDIHDPLEVEWAVATRVQPDRDITVIRGARGSSLDPSRNPQDNTTAKWIVDATIPAGRPRHEFLKVEPYRPE